MDCVPFEGAANQDDVIVSNAIREHVLVVSMNNDIDGIVFIVSFLEILDKRVVRLQTRLLSLLLVKIDNIALD